MGAWVPLLARARPAQTVAVACKRIHVSNQNFASRRPKITHTQNRLRKLASWEPSKWVKSNVHLCLRMPQQVPHASRLVQFVIDVDAELYILCSVYYSILKLPDLCKRSHGTFLPAPTAATLINMSNIEKRETITLLQRPSGRGGKQLPQNKKYSKI